MFGVGVEHKIRQTSVMCCECYLGVLSLKVGYDFEYNFL